MATADITEHNPKRHRNSPNVISADFAPPQNVDIIADIRVGLRQAKAGEGRPAQIMRRHMADPRLPRRVIDDQCDLLVKGRLVLGKQRIAPRCHPRKYVTINSALRFCERQQCHLRHRTVINRLLLGMGAVFGLLLRLLEPALQPPGNADHCAAHQEADDRVYRHHDEHLDELVADPPICEWRATVGSPNIHAWRIARGESANQRWDGVLIQSASA